MFNIVGKIFIVIFTLLSILKRNIFLFIKSPLIFFYYFYEYKNIKNRKILKKLKTYRSCYNYLLYIYNTELSTKISMYFLINYYKLIFTCLIIQNFIFIYDILARNFYFFNYNKRDVQSSRKTTEIAFFKKKRIKVENEFVAYIKMLRRDYFSDYLIKYWISWAENRFRDFRAVVWIRLERYFEKAKEPFLELYSSIVFRTLYLISYVPLGLINFIFFFIILIIFKFLNFIYNSLYDWLYPKYLRFRFRLKKKIERFKEYSILCGFAAILIISYNKYRKSWPDYVEFYRANLKFTRVGAFFGPIYGILGLWHGFLKGRWRGSK